MEEKKLLKERQELFSDLADGKTPKRVPVVANIIGTACADYSGHSYWDALWNTETWPAIYDKVCADFPTDTYPCAPFPRSAAMHRLLDSINYVCDERGMLQHPEVSSMKADEYDDFIKDPFKFICETAAPRLYKALDAPAAQYGAKLTKAANANREYTAAKRAVTKSLVEKYQYVVFEAGFTMTPADFVAACLRSFSGISADVRRQPQKVKEACAAVTPLLIRLGMPQNATKIGRVGFPTHMAPYWSRKQTEEIWWPYFNEMLKTYADAGHNSYIVFENDWTRYLDLIKEMPGVAEMRFEYGDPKQIKRALEGSRHVISGLYPIMTLSTLPKEKCIDKAKEYIDILAPGGHYTFSFDKSFLDIRDKTGENLRAVLNYVINNTDY